jgi:exosome complex component RRP4
MAITILAPVPAAMPYHYEVSSDESDDDGGVDLQGGVSMPPAKRAKRARHAKDIVTPGETVTDDPQWMRYAFQSSMLYPIPASDSC